jgi:hypothetical protein
LIADDFFGADETLLRVDNADETRVSHRRWVDVP